VPEEHETRIRAPQPRPSVAIVERRRPRETLEHLAADAQWTGAALRTRSLGGSTPSGGSKMGAWQNGHASALQAVLSAFDSRRLQNSRLAQEVERSVVTRLTVVRGDHREPNFSQAGVRVQVSAIATRASGETVSAPGSEPGARKSMRVQISPCPHHGSDVLLEWTLVRKTRALSALWVRVPPLPQARRRGVAAIAAVSYTVTHRFESDRRHHERDHAGLPQRRQGLLRKQIAKARVGSSPTAGFNKLEA
jgi:hypothetical protein